MAETDTYSWNEYLVLCPGCKVLESLDFNGKKLVQTKRFQQNRRGTVYHTCGTTQPCQVFDLAGHSKDLTHD